jgi:lysophospholipase L1-like esterase
MKWLRELGANDLVLFLGDSITEQHLWTQHLENLLLFHRPELRFRNRGWAANRAVDGVERFDRDVAPLHPDWVLIAFGMNDGGYRPLSSRLLEQYRGALAELVHRVQAAGAKAILVSPTCVQEDRDPVLTGYNATLEAFSATCREVAQQERVPCVDLFAPSVAALRPDAVWAPDGIHPCAEAHLLLARAAATQLGVPFVAGPEGAPVWGLPYRASVPSDDHVTAYVDGTPADNYEAAALEPGVLLTGGSIAARHRAVLDLTRSIWLHEKAVWRQHGPAAPEAGRSPATAQALSRAVAALEVERSRLADLSAVAVALVPETPVALTYWEVSGPYPVRGADPYTATFAPEGGPGTLEPWRPVTARAKDGFVDFLSLWGPTADAVAYARTTVEAPFAGDLLLSLGSDDGFQVFVDGAFVAGKNVFRGSAPGQDLICVPVAAGPNQLLLRIHQGIGGWDFYAAGRLRKEATSC